MTEGIDPLAAKVAQRWKTVSKGNRPLLTLDGSGELRLSRRRHNDFLSEMSAGERAVALVVTRLLALGARVPSSFMWLDEPFEQLDPSNRGLSRSSWPRRPAPVRQLIVTTFRGGDRAAATAAGS